MMRRLAVLVAVACLWATPAFAKPDVRGMRYWCGSYDRQSTVFGIDQDNIANLIGGLTEAKGKVPHKWARKITNAPTEAAQIATVRLFLRDCVKRDLLVR